MSDKQLTIGLFGFGVVGEGIYNVLKQTPSLNARVKTICIKHAWKKRNVSAELLTTSYDAILEDPEINVVVELIDDADEAFKIVTKALSQKKAVVSANKKMIAEHLTELLNLQKEHATPLLYEAAVCGSIPVIRNLEEYYDNEMLQAISGIINGSTNFILTKIIDEGLEYKEALLLAQQQGFAESNPTLDVKGIDASNKLAILLAHAYGIVTQPDKLLHIGITQIRAGDAGLADEKNYKIKLTAQARKLSSGAVAAFVLPQFVTSESQLFYVKNEFNGVVIESTLSDKQFISGKGAGRYPTSSAVLSDISALRYDYKYEYRKLNSAAKNLLTNDFYLKVYVSFDNWNDISRDDFEWLEEYHSNEKRQYLVGVIHFEKLKNCTWLHKDPVSLIICPNGIIESIELRMVQRRSLELAGIL